MAAITRRTFPVLRDEAIACGGGHNHAGWPARVEQWMWAAYLDLCSTYHFHELEAFTTFTPADGDTTVSLPPDCFAVASLAWSSKPQSSGIGRALQLKEERLQAILARRTQPKGQWIAYARLGTTLILDCPLLLTASTPSLPLTLHYYKRPAAVDFSDASASNVPVFTWEWDDHLIDATVAKIQARAWTWDQAGLTTQTLQAWLQAQTQPSLLTEPQTNPPDMPTANKPQGGGARG